MISRADLGPFALTALAFVAYITIKGRAAVYGSLVSSLSSATAPLAPAAYANPTAAARSTGIPGSTSNPIYGIEPLGGL